ncbi:MAG: hypothetical protein D6729_13820 [Deltaproteobacteria bacterium]|nr:MAG: hypothetical protein D6729_13820 [Deltaproteobacteria bacterium]
MAAQTTRRGSAPPCPRKGLRLAAGTAGFRDLARAAVAALWTIAGMACGQAGGAGASGVTPAPAGRATLGERMCISDERFSLGAGAQAAEERAWHLDRIEELGIRWLRLDLRWRTIEPEQGRFVFDVYDPGLQEISARGLKLLAILDDTPDWAAVPLDGGPAIGAPAPADPTVFGGFAAEVGTRYGPELGAVEIWNEQNSGFRFWAPKEDPAAYAELLHAGAEALRRTAPDLPILYGGLFFHAQAITGGPAFLDAHLRAHPDAGGEPGDFDVLAFHPYPLYPPSVGPEFEDEGEVAFDTMVAEMRAVLDAHGIRRPLWATEYGWPAFHPVTPELQAAYLVRGAALLASVGVERLCWFTLVDGPGTGRFPPEDDFGLFAWDVERDAPGPPKPAHSAVATLMRIAGALAPTGATPLVDPPRGVVGYRFANKDGTRFADVVYALDEAYASAVELRVPAEAKVEAWDLFGNPASAEPTPRGVRIHASTLPVWVAGTVGTR